MAISQVSLAAMFLATSLAEPLTNAELFPAHFPETDPLYEQLDAVMAGPVEDSEGAELMKQMMIQLFDMKPIHVDSKSSTSTQQQPVAGKKTQKKQKHGKVVEREIGGLGWDSASSQVDANNVGTSEEATFQMALSWVAPLFLDTVDKYTLLSANPKFILEVLGSFKFTVHLRFIEITLAVNVNPFKFTPFDILLRSDMMHTQRYCTGLDYKVRTFTTDLMIETRVNECFYGLIGTLTDNDPSDCTWRAYRPELPLYRFASQDIGDMDGSYIDYHCVNWYSAQWEEWPLSQEYIDSHRN